MRVPAPFFGDEIDDAARLEVADDHLLRTLGMNETAVQFRNGQKLLLLDGFDLVRAEPVAPFGRDGGLFMHGQAFGEPARHAAAGSSSRVNTWLISCQRVDAQWNVPGLRPDGLSMATE